MIFYHSKKSLCHDTENFFRHGAIIPNPENTARYISLRDAILSTGQVLQEAPDQGLAALAAVHDPAYLEFLAGAWGRRAEIDEGAVELLPTQFAKPQMQRRPEGLRALLGFYAADTSTPIRAGTWDAIYASAQVALAAADAAGETGAAYALCRPPGHHAYADCAGGFCYLNNTAIAAQRLRQRFDRPVAILDIDVHHGNGTQGIFYRRSDVLTVSVHADPSNYFPFYAGYAEQVGEGEGAGCNLNLPLPHGSGDPAYLAAVARGIERVKSFQPAALVVALGLDASEQDPLGVLEVTRAGFATAGRLIAALGLPTALIQEGGYAGRPLQQDLLAFLDGFGR
jgi:acetoin utilization deacetylase AcuC-like enzyme